MTSKERSRNCTEKPFGGTGRYFPCVRKRFDLCEYGRGGLSSRKELSLGLERVFLKLQDVALSKKPHNDILILRGMEWGKTSRILKTKKSNIS